MKRSVSFVVLHLISNGKNRLGLGSDKVDAGISARPGKVSVLGQETVSYHGQVRVFALVGSSVVKYEANSLNCHSEGMVPG